MQDDNKAVNKRPKNIPELLIILKQQGVPESRIPDIVRRFHENKAREKGVPYYGHFELTPLCNLDCKMCYVHLDKEQMGSTELMGVDKWIRIADDAVKMGMMCCQLTGGECLTYPEFDELYLHLHSLGIEVDVYTNGILLSDSRIEFFKAHPPKCIQISLYGTSEDNYYKVTGHRQYERVTSNILKCKEAKLPIQLSITPSVYNADDVENIIRLAQSFDVPYLINWNLFVPRENTGRSGIKADVSVDDYVRYYTLRAELQGKAVTPVDMTELPDFGGSEKGTGKGLYCGGGRSSFSVGYDGKMYICGMLRDSVAEPLEIGFENAWRIINDAAENYPVPLECNGCKYRGLCPVCVAQHHYGAQKGKVNRFICERTRYMAAKGLLNI